MYHTKVQLVKQFELMYITNLVIYTMDRNSNVTTILYILLGVPMSLIMEYQYYTYY